jgi:hypothetical protein
LEDPSAGVGEPRQRRIEPVARFAKLGQLLPLGFHHFGGRLGDELRVAELLLDAGDLVGVLRQLFSAFRSIRSPSGRQAVASPMTIWAEPFGAASAKPTSLTRASRRIAGSWRAARSRVAAFAPTKTSGAVAAGGTFISERTERMPETRSISQLISAAASESSKSGAGHAAWHSSVSRGAPSPAVCAQSSSVMNGIIGWSSL